MEKQILLSIILPVYNVKKELPRCLDSLMNQAFPLEKLEVIAIDDGSIDGSSDILQDYAQRCPFLHVYRQENHGVGAARNAGLDKASGYYVAFVDSDDYILPEYAEVLTGFMEKSGSDMGLSDVLVERKGLHYAYLDNYCWRRFSRKTHTPVKLSEEPELLLFQPSVWRRIFRRDFLLNRNIRFPESLLYEDIPFHYRTLHMAESIILIPQALYIYNYDRSDSITKGKDHRLFDFLKIFSLVHRENQQRNIYSYVFENRYLKWAVHKIDPLLRSEFNREKKKSIAYYHPATRIAGFFLRLKIKLIQGITNG